MVTPLNSSERSGIKTKRFSGRHIPPNPKDTLFLQVVGEQTWDDLYNYHEEKASVYLKLSCETEGCPGGPTAVEGKRLHAGLAGRTKQDKAEE